MITDLFEGMLCKTCGGSDFQRRDILSHESGRDFLCSCRTCGTLFIRQFAREGGYRG
jgi:uncharacterized Zn finger protein